MSEELGLAGLAAYLADHPGARASMRVKLNAVAAPEPPTFFHAVPRGDLFIFPAGFAFLTSKSGKLGAGMMLQAMFDQLVDEAKVYVKLHAWGSNPATILVDIGKALWGNLYANQDYLKAALVNPNSFYVPFSMVKSVEPARMLSQGNYIKVKLVSGGVTLCENMTRENVFKAGFSFLSGQWEPALVAALREGAARHVAS